jgi:formamidopyrimidine-DNA glycosylase
MPELPEVETVARSLRQLLAGLTIEAVDIRHPEVVDTDHKVFRRALAGAKLKHVRRRGKNLLIDLSNGQTLWIHLRMTGHFDMLPDRTPYDKHDHIVFHFRENGHNLRFNDYRRFGRMKLFPTDSILSQKGLAELGPEPLEISTDDFIRLCRSKSRMVKHALLDQTFLAGLGNIYADESLFLSRIHPQALTDRISRAKLLLLRENIRKLLQKSIRLMGTSVDSFVGLNGRTGSFQKYLLVYGREGEPCRNCGRTIVRRKIAGRSTYFCRSCQRAPRKKKTIIRTY